jgi:Protein of unknown function (DUF551)
VSKWISVKDAIPPAMETVILCHDCEVIVGWNESVFQQEDPSYCTWEEPRQGFIENEKVTHWMPLPDLPEDK